MELYRMRGDMLPKIHFVDEAVMGASWRHRKRKDLEYIMYVAKHGEMYLEEDGVPLCLKAGDMCILDKDRTHVGVRPSECEYYYVHFMHDDFRLLRFADDREAVRLLSKSREEALNSDIFSYDQCENSPVYLPRHCHIGSKAVRFKVEELLQMAMQENYKSVENYKVMCACYVQQAFMEISRCFLDEAGESQRSGRPVYYEMVGKMVEWLNQNYGKEVASPFLEELFGHNFDYMNRVFKKVNGKTVFQYLTQVRIHHAKLLLCNTFMKIGEIGKRVGFPDEYYFSRVFKKYTGISPAAFARSGQGGEKENFI